MRKKRRRVVAALLMMGICVSCEDFTENETGETTAAAPTLQATTSDGEPTGEPTVAEALPFSWGQVKWVSGDGPVGGWAQTVELGGVSIGGSAVSWRYNKPPGNWQRTGAIKGNPNACLGWVTMVNGQWYGVITEWLLPGQTSQANKVFQSDRGNMLAFKSPLQNFTPSHGQTFYVFVCGLNWSGQKNVRERSNAMAAVYP